MRIPFFKSMADYCRRGFRTISPVLIFRVKYKTRLPGHKMFRIDFMKIEMPYHFVTAFKDNCKKVIAFTSFCDH